MCTVLPVSAGNRGVDVSPAFASCCLLSPELYRKPLALTELFHKSEKYVPFKSKGWGSHLVV